MNIMHTKRAAFNVTTGVMSYILPQNGVAEGPIHCGPGASAPQVAMDSALDSHNGNVETPKRPRDLVVDSVKGFSATKGIREDSQDIDGSLPCTPDNQTDSETEVSSCSPACEAFEADTRQLISRFLREYTGLSKPGWKESAELTTMKRVVEDVLAKHRYAYNGMINKLSLEDRGQDATFVSAVAKSLFADGTTNWGRIASLMAFGAAVSQNLKDNGRGDCVELVAEGISSYLLTDQRDWLVKNNSWDGFVDFFRVADPESTVRTTLMAFAGFAGIGATLALLIR